MSGHLCVAVGAAAASVERCARCMACNLPGPEHGRMLGVLSGCNSPVPRATSFAVQYQAYDKVSDIKQGVMGEK
jgi:hypothetical protein